MKIQSSALTENAIALALNAELSAPPRLLPEDASYPAILGDVEGTAEWIHGRIFAASFTPTPEETVGASKTGHGVRPIAVWDLPSKVAYRALVSRLEDHLPELPRARTKYRDFQRKPLDRPGKYIVAADIAACYQNLDHGLVLEEVGVQTNEHSSIDAIGGLLREATGRTYGLPQQSHASDVLAEVFLSKLERSLTRRGLAVDRYNDDFRFACPSWGEVIRTLEVLEAETRRVGLTINDMKTVTWRHTTYGDQLDMSATLRDEIAQEAELDLTTYDEDPYGEVTVTAPSSEDVDVHTASKVLDQWRLVSRNGRVAPRNRLRHRAIVELIPFALATLGEQADTSEGVLNSCVKLLRYEQTITPAVAKYLQSRHDDAAVIAAVDSLLSSRAYLNGWQIWWLQHPVARLSALAEGPGAQRRLRWTRLAFESAQNSPVLRAEAARTLARHRQIDVDELLRVYDRSSDIVRPTLAAAVALLAPSADVRASLTGESFLNGLTYEWSARFA